MKFWQSKIRLFGLLDLVKRKLRRFRLRPGGFIRGRQPSLQKLLPSVGMCLRDRKQATDVLIICFCITGYVDSPVVQSVQSSWRSLFPDCPELIESIYCQVLQRLRVYDSGADIIEFTRTCPEYRVNTIVFFIISQGR